MKSRLASESSGMLKSRSSPLGDGTLVYIDFWNYSVQSELTVSSIDCLPRKCALLSDNQISRFHGNTVHKATALGKK